MTKFTPGPRRLDGPHIKNAAGDVLASVPYSLGDASDRANARLMAAAPILLDALRLLASVADGARYSLAQAAANPSNDAQNRRIYAENAAALEEALGMASKAIGSQTKENADIISREKRS